MNALWNHVIWAVPGIGLLGLATYQASVGQYDAAINSLLSALAVFGLRRVDANTDKAVAILTPRRKSCSTS